MSIDHFVQECRKDPLLLKDAFWPNINFYRKQRDIILSEHHNVETVVVAGNQLGKDFVAAYITLKRFLLYHPVRIVTTSATDRHLNVLWGEIDRFIRAAKVPLTVERGGPLVYNHHDLKKKINGVVDRGSYLIGAVASSSQEGEGLAGHHAQFTLGVIDEASGVSDIAYKQMQGWAKKMLIFGNPFDCNNFFRRAVKEGDLKA